MKQELLSIRNLNVSYKEKHALKDFSYSFYKNECYAILGASGAGKSTAIKSIAYLLPDSAKVDGCIYFNDILVDPLSIESLRGKEISYLSQDISSYFNPVYTLQKQVERAIFLSSRSINKKDKRNLAREALRWAELKEEDFKLYPHEASGGMLNRAALAIAYATKAKLILLDEPTSGLDRALEEQVLSSLKRLVDEIGATLIFVTHSIHSAISFADKIIVMKDGKIEESGKASDIVKCQKSEYGKALFDAYSLIGECDA